jgi:hypothetical protein
VLNVRALLYPASASAAGIALLRLTAGAFVLVLRDAVAMDSFALSAVAWSIATMLAAGFLTRCVALSVGAAELALVTTAASGTIAFHAVGVGATFALALIGAGALSVDAYLFGRRVIELVE